MKRNSYFIFSQRRVLRDDKRTHQSVLYACMCMCVWEREIPIKNRYLLRGIECSQISTFIKTSKRCVILTWHVLDSLTKIYLRNLTDFNIAFSHRSDSKSTEKHSSDTTISSLLAALSFPLFLFFSLCPFGTFASQKGDWVWDFRLKGRSGTKDSDALSNEWNF